MNLTTKEKSNLLSDVLVKGDLSELSSEQKVSHLKAVCESLGLNPLTRPFEYISLNGKLTLYAKRDATDQLRAIHRVSVEIVSREKVHDCYVVTARAKTPDGRTDESVGAVYLGRATGDSLANLFMKAETKAKRRVTLSICGLGILDEMEVDTIPGAQKAQQIQVKTEVQEQPREIASKATDKLRLAREAVYQLANNYNLTNEMIRATLLQRYKKESSKDLQLSELEDLADFLTKTYG
jgi:hypothetical protein